MALIDCPECGRQVSSNAPTCVGCGAPIADTSYAKIASTAPPNSGGRAKRGERVPYTDQEVAVLLSKKKKTSHVLHLLLSIFTVGIWLVIWLLVAASNGSENQKIDKMIAKGKKV